MELRGRADIEAPLDFVFEQITNFEKFERLIMRRGADVIRQPGPNPPEIGAKWLVEFRLRGKLRAVNGELAQIDKDSGMRIDIESKNIVGSTTVELVALSKARTRMIVVIDVTAKTIPAKLLFQSMRLARKRMKARFKARIAGYGEEIETRYRG